MTWQEKLRAAVRQELLRPVKSAPRVEAPHIPQLDVNTLLQSSSAGAVCVRLGDGYEGTQTSSSE
jgi:hypothetical protein